MNYTVQLNKTFEQALKDIETASNKFAFKIQHIHNVSDILNEKGFPIEKYSIIELCNPKFAYAVLSKNKIYGSILPCKFLLYEKDGKLFLSAPNPIDLVEKLEMSDIKEIAQQVQEIIKSIILEVEK
ncbi:MAG: DUF302 domain-containing protein [Candidatus Anstonellales archaeon]